MLLLPAFFMLYSSCTYDTVKPIDPRSKCEQCHTNYALLQQVYSPDTEAPAGGCGGEAPHFEPYDRVFMGGEGYAAYKKTAHYNIGCTECHGGDGNTNEKDAAHSGGFIAQPSSVADKTCKKCHDEIVTKFANSIHTGVGQKRKVTMRSGLAGEDEFAKLPAHQIEGYTKNCATCHGTCGNCHVVRPATGGGGLLNGHMFNKEPDMINTCVVCHVSRGGHAYLGIGKGTVPDVHLTKKGFNCLDCHTGAELHGDGMKVSQRYEYKKLPKCTDCHQGQETTNMYHSVHYDDFNCQVCHSQDYNNCGSCHVHGEGARVPSYMDFKIAVNPLPTIKTGFKFATVRRTLAAPDNFVEYGLSKYANFDVLPMYNFTTPHNIQRFTKRTTGSDNCASNCHIRVENGVQINRNLYLFESDLKEAWEKSSTKHLTVDGKLPANWFK
ncbi:MAG TPA: hypothetical protein DCQ31_09505 [Bacteroidales bacterium]|nr:hypothetical protein [Bacteroidales bacterium]